MAAIFDFYRCFRSFAWLHLLLLIALPQCLAQLPQIETPINEVRTGDSIAIEYTPADAVATFVLRKGPSTNLGTVETLTESATGGTWTWKVSNSLESGDDYALEIIVDGNSNFAGQFSIVGGGSSNPPSSPPPSAPPSSELPPPPATTRSSAPPTSKLSEPSSAANSALASVSSIPSDSSRTQSRDSATSTGTHDPSGEPSGTATSTGGSFSEETSTTNNDPPPATGSSSGLSTGAKAGIGVGVAVGVLAVGLGAFLLGKRARRDKSHATPDIEHKPELDGNGIAKGGAPVEEIRSVGDPAELDAEKLHYYAPETRNELDNEGVRREMASTPVPPRWEAPGNIPDRAYQVPGPQQVVHEMHVPAANHQTHTHAFEDSRLTDNPWAPSAR